MALKIRHGALTGTPRDGAGAYFSLDGSREGMVGLALISYGVKSGRKGEGGKVVQLWPAAGQHRVTALRLALDSGLEGMLSRYALATRDFSAGGGYLRLKVGSRIWRRDAVKEEIRFDAGSSSIVFLKNSGPFADSLLRGDFVSIEVGMNGWTDTYGIPEGATFNELQNVGAFQPVSTCDVSLSTSWYGKDVPGAAYLMGADGGWIKQVQAWYKKGKKGGKGGMKFYDAADSVRGLSGGPFSVWLYGVSGTAKVSVTYPAAQMALNAKILEIIVQ